MHVANVPILVYHQIADRPLLGQDGRYIVSPDQFGAQMAYLHDHGYRSLALADLVASRRQYAPVPARSFVLTFDDGYRETHTIAAPALHRYGFSATVFLVTGCVETVSQWERETGSPMLTWDQITDLRASDFTVGSHTRTHPNLTQLTPDQVQRELADSKADLEQHIGEPVHWLAYPYGRSTPDIRAAASSAGYLAACGLISGPGDCYNLWRQAVRTSDTLRAFAWRLTAPYLTVWRFRRWLREDTRVGRQLHRRWYRAPDEGAAGAGGKRPETAPGGMGDGG